MASRAITDAMYDQMLQAFRDHGPDYSTVAKLVGVQPRTARRAWLTGWPRRVGGSWAQPMKVILDREKLEARAKLGEQEPLPKPIEDRARADAAQQLVETVQMVRNSRRVATAALGVAATMLPPIFELAKQLPTLCKTATDLKTVSRLIDRVLLSSERVIAMADRAQIMEHREAGKPTDILALAGLADTGQGMSLEEAERELVAANNALKRAKELGITVIDGGGTQPPAKLAN